MAAHARLKNEFTEDEKCHNLMIWLTSNIPQLSPGIPSTAPVPPVRVYEKGVRKSLDGLNPHKATGPDLIYSRFLKEMSASISYALTLILQVSYGQVPDDGKEPTQLLSSRKAYYFFHEGIQLQACLTNIGLLQSDGTPCPPPHYEVHWGAEDTLRSATWPRETHILWDKLINAIQDLVTGLNNHQ